MVGDKSNEYELLDYKMIWDTKLMFAWLYKSIYYIRRALRLFIAPSFCAYCKKFLWDDDILCVSCMSKIQLVVSHELPIAPRKSIRVFAISLYRDPLRRLLLAKLSDNCAVARQLGHLLWMMTDIQFQDFDYIVPVPLHWKRYAWRGYNQAYEMAYVISKYSGKPVIDALIRTRATVTQAMLSGIEKDKNVSDVFRMKESMKDRVKGMRILLIDDLMTSGSTLRACAKELYRYDIGELKATVICRVM